MSTLTRTWTYADLDELPEEQTGNRYEIIGGRLIVTPSPVPLHESLGIELTLEFGNFVKAGHLGRVFGDRVDVKLNDEVVIPDLLFIRRDRLGIIGPAAIEGAPDLVLEILSPSTRERDLGEKLALYARFGIPEYWVVDPKARSITVYVLRGDRYEPLPQEDGIARSEVLPGLAIDVAALFAAAEI
jgi:Uma2 family endonuclease